MIRLRNKKGQITIWVIIAIVLVFSIILFFFIDQKAVIKQSEEFDPTSYIKECAEKYVNEAVDIILPQGGFLEPKNYARYKNTNIEFLCQNKGNFNTCINQHPLILTEIKKELPDLTNFEKRLNRKINIINSNADNMKKEFKNSLANGIVAEGYAELIK